MKVFGLKFGERVFEGRIINEDLNAQNGNRQGFGNRVYRFIDYSKT